MWLNPARESRLKMLRILSLALRYLLRRGCHGKVKLGRSGFCGKENLMVCFQDGYGYMAKACR
jgi:hypothetical protein